MTDSVLVLNCGSSSIKYQLVAPDARAHVAGGAIERVGEELADLEHRHAGSTTTRRLAVPTHRGALAAMLAMFDEHGPSLRGAGIVAVGHRVVMGGDQFSTPVRIDADVVAAIDRLAPLAPLHNPANLAGIELARELLPDVPHVAVFDTAFFHQLPAAAATYALDRRLAAEHGIRRYGFHGTSHQYVARRAVEVLGRHPDGVRQIVLHLGNGASASAIVGGVPVETSMGLTPLEGLVMGTRTGDIDPAVFGHLSRTAGMSVEEIEDVLNRRSGLRGLAGANDMRAVHRLIAAGDADARLALDVYVHRLKKYIGAYTAIMGGIDVLTFTAGVGEHDAVTRAESVAGLGFLGLAIDPARNTAVRDDARVISPDGAPVTVLVVPTDEEMAIALEAMELLSRR